MGSEKTEGSTSYLVLRPEFNLGYGWRLPASREMTNGVEFSLGVTVGQGIPMGRMPEDESAYGTDFFFMDIGYPPAVPMFVHGGYLGYSHRVAEQMTSYKDGIYTVMNVPVRSDFDSLSLGYRVGFEGLVLAGGIYAGAGVRGFVRYGDDDGVMTGGAFYAGAYAGPWGMWQVGYEHEWGKMGQSYEADLVTLGGAFPMRISRND